LDVCRSGFDRAFLLVASQEGLQKVQLDMTELETAMPVDRALNSMGFTADVNEEMIYAVIYVHSSTQMWSAKLADANHTVVGHCASVRVFRPPDE